MPNLREPGVESNQSEYWLDLRRSLQQFVSPRVERDAVEDIASGVMLKLVTKRDELTSATDPMAWLYRAASNAVTDYYRRRAAERRLQSAAAVEMSIDPNELLQSDEHTSWDLSKCMAPMIGRLAPHYSEALTLVAIDGFSQVEAAQKLHVPVTTLKSRVQRGRLKLRDELLDCCAVEVDRRGNVVDAEQRAENPTACGC